VETVGRSPFALGGVEWLSVNAIVAFAFVGGVALFTASQYLRFELIPRVSAPVAR
jgi:hypothetical protein